MALKTINQKPKINDTILLEIETPDTNGCFVDDPYRVDNVTIYYIERDFLGQNFGEYQDFIVLDTLQQSLDEARKTYCDDPSEVNLNNLNKITNEVNSSAQKPTFYYKDRVAIKVIGTPTFPAWIETDIENSPLTLESEDENGDPQFGHFSYEWSPNGSIREGDYFICWTWSPLVDGDKLSAHLHFTIDGDQSAVVSIPTHQTPPDKYDILLEKYLPEIYKTTLADVDLTPEVTANLNKAIGDGFTFIENMANQIIDLFDANVLHESLLAYLSNLFGLRLKSHDPTLWRRQIKEAIGLFKRKGTLQGLKDAFAQAGMILNSATQYWQLVSPYTWFDVFVVKNSPTFTLTQSTIVEPIDTDNFGLWLKRDGETNYTELTKDYVEFTTTDDGQLQMTWIGDELSSGGISIFSGDHIKILYEYNEVPGSPEQTLENYLRTLPLMDQRDEDDQEFPLKNWNVRLIADDDTLFDSLIPVRHPFHDPLTFGHIRTEFAYSENIYNMDEYNGSKRPSHRPCDIDKNFIDPCGACLSSTISVDIGIEELSNDRILEAQDILREYKPFHAQVYSMNFAGDVNEFMPSPVETVTTLITIDHSQFVLSGNANPFFNRLMHGGLTDSIITRTDLIDEATVASGLSGTAYNDHVSLVVPNHNLSSLGVIPVNHILEVLAPSANAGTYTINQIEKNTAKVPSPTLEPIDETGFTFNLSNINYQNFNTSITQDDLVVLSDETVNFAELGVKTQWDVDNTPDYSGGPWKVSIPAYSVTPYEVIDIRGDNLLLDGDSTLPTTDTTGVTYSLLNDVDDEMATSDDGVLDISRRGYVNLNDGVLVDIEHFIRVGDLFYYDGTEYVISEFDNLNFWIEDYSDGDVAGVTIQTRRRLLTEVLGYFGYSGLLLTTDDDHEADLEMINGSNPPPEDQQPDDSHFKENFLFLIDGNYYKIVSINGIEVVLTGRNQNWTTVANGGTMVTYSIVHITKEQVTIGFTVFDQLGRDGKSPVTQELFSDVDQSSAISILSIPKSAGVQENAAQEEEISFTIERRDGQSDRGKYDQ